MTKMAVKMAIGFWITVVISLIGANASGEFTILHSPESLKFTGQTKTFETILKDVFSASLGLSVEENTEWNGLYIVDPFDTPEAAVEVYVDGIRSLFDNDQVKKYPLTVDEYEPDTYEAVAHRIKQHFNNAGNKLVSIKLSDPKELSSYPEIFGDIPAPKVSKRTLQYLKYYMKEDFQFLTELEALKAITSKVKAGVLKPDNLIDFFYFRFTSLHALSDLHGENSMATKEAKKLLTAELHELSEAFTKAYEHDVLVTAVATDVAHTRRTIRAAPERQEPEADFSSDNYSGDYPAIFNIIVWFVVVLIFTMVAIVYTMIDMDPGRDSIIYRMTSMRTKKDN